jgi:ADP-heptose:LPS heptosyltransferase
LIEAPRILCVPVSGARGMGEYARSVAIAQTLRLRWPAADIHFVVSRQAPYAAATPFPATLLASSPTFHSAAVIELINSFHPDLVIFDNAGRTAQLRAAHRSGARVVYISARARQRRKAFRMRWMRLLDEHWIAYPEFIAGPLTAWERLKLKMLHRPTIRYLDVILAPSAGQPSSLPARLGWTEKSYVLVVPGGGTGHPGAKGAVGQFFAAAKVLADGGVATVFVGPTGADAGAASGTTAAVSRLRCFDSLPQSDLAELMRGARLIIANGGSTLLQALASGGACIGVPIAHDQDERIKRCVEAGAAAAAGLNVAGIVNTARELLGDESARQALATRAADLGLADGAAVALGAVARLLETK